MPDTRPLLLDLPERFAGPGPRVLVRPFTDGDASAQHAANRELVEHLRPWMPWYDQHETLGDTRAWVPIRVL